MNALVVYIMLRLSDMATHSSQQLVCKQYSYTSHYAQHSLTVVLAEYRRHRIDVHTASALGLAGLTDISDTLVVFRAVGEI